MSVSPLTCKEVAATAFAATIFSSESLSQQVRSGSESFEAPDQAAPIEALVAFRVLQKDRYSLASRLTAERPSHFHNWNENYRRAFFLTSPNFGSSQ